MTMRKGGLEEFQLLEPNAVEEIHGGIRRKEEIEVGDIMREGKTLAKGRDGKWRLEFYGKLIDRLHEIDVLRIFYERVEVVRRMNALHETLSTPTASGYMAKSPYLNAGHDKLLETRS